MLKSKYVIASGVDEKPDLEGFKPCLRILESRSPSSNPLSPFTLEILFRAQS